MLRGKSFPSRLLAPSSPPPSESHQFTLHSCKPAEMPLPLPIYQGERPAHPTPPLATKPPGPYDTHFQDRGRKRCFPRGALPNSWERMVGTLEGLEKLLIGHVIPMPFSQGLRWPFGKWPHVPPLSSPASKLLLGRVEASQAEAQRGVYPPALKQLLGYNVFTKQGPPRDMDQNLH